MTRSVRRNLRVLHKSCLPWMGLPAICLLLSISQPSGTSLLKQSFCFFEMVCSANVLAFDFGQSVSRLQGTKQLQHNFCSERSSFLGSCCTLHMFICWKKKLILLNKLKDIALVVAY